MSVSGAPPCAPSSAIRPPVSSNTAPPIRHFGSSDCRSQPTPGVSRFTTATRARYSPRSRLRDTASTATRRASGCNDARSGNGCSLT